MKKICIVTSTRADYGLLYWPLKELSKVNMISTDLVVTGTHLSKKHGYTVDAIKADHFPINAEIDIEVGGDRPGDILRIMSVTLNKFSQYFETNKPDLLLILGDRFEIFAVAQAALVHNIPIAHIHGGEVTEGAIDDAFRHAITKLSYLHFTSTEEYRQRVIQLGEDPGRVFTVGAPGLDNIKKLKLLSKEELSREISCFFNEKNILVTFHPVTISEEQTIKETKNFFSALAKLPENVSFFITMPNADTFSENILTVIKEFKNKLADRAYLYSSLGQLRYLSLMKQVDIVAGNSSSGIIEAPFMNKVVINVGDRQKGRSSSAHVIHVGSGEEDIYKSFVKGLDKNLESTLSVDQSIYGDGESGARIANLLSDFFQKNITNTTKSFRDIKNI